jgi:hypothetical protein
VLAGGDAGFADGVGVPQTGQLAMEGWAVKSVTVAKPVSPMQAAQRQYPEVEG